MMGPHPTARCCWCQSPLVEGDLAGTIAWFCPTLECRDRQVKQAIDLTYAKEKKRVVLFVPVPKQVVAWECPAPNILWGGAAGPGKSTGARWWLYRKCLTIPGFEALLLRENLKQLESTHERRMAAEADAIGAELNQTKHVLKLRNGSLIQMGHMDDADAVQNYLSTEYDAIVCDEGSRYPLAPDGSVPLIELSTRARSNKPAVLASGGAKFLVVSNPGGPSSSALLDFFVDHQPDFDTMPALREVWNPDDWVYVPATLDDNPYIDPNYLVTLARLPKWRYEQLRHGNWRVFAGQFFSEWEESRDGEPWHVRRLAA